MPSFFIARARCLCAVFSVIPLTLAASFVAYFSDRSCKSKYCFFESVRRISCLFSCWRFLCVISCCIPQMPARCPSATSLATLFTNHRGLPALSTSCVSRFLALYPAFMNSRTVSMFLGSSLLAKKGGGVFREVHRVRRSHTSGRMNRCRTQSAVPQTG